MEIYREFTFDAAHSLRSLEESHKCSRLHGHTFTVRIHLEGEVDPVKGWVMDFGEIRRICSPVIDILDHSNLNDLPGLGNPTSENIAVWLWERLSPGLPLLSMIEVMETPGNGCRYRG
jgi:6-pyruvoyltetrahydropterin/6-carboxytetrahydropterin synthase